MLLTFFTLVHSCLCHFDQSQWKITSSFFKGTTQEQLVYLIGAKQLFLFSVSCETGKKGFEFFALNFINCHITSILMPASHCVNVLLVRAC